MRVDYYVKHVIASEWKHHIEYVSVLVETDENGSVSDLDVETDKQKIFVISVDF